MTDTIFFEIDFLHLGIEKGDGDDEEKADKPGSFSIRKQTNLTRVHSNGNQNKKKIVKCKKIVIKKSKPFW